MRSRTFPRLSRLLPARSLSSFLAISSRAFSLAFRLFNTWIAVQVAYENDLISDFAFAGYQADVAGTVAGLPGFRRYWLGLIEANPALAGSAILAPLVE